MGSEMCIRDRSHIAFVSERDGNHEIYIMNADGSEMLNISNSPSFDLDPDWSPDGKTIVFSSNRESSEPGQMTLWTMSSDGGNLQEIPVKGGARAATWAPDGSKIAFTSFRDDGDAEIYVMNSDGSVSYTHLTLPTILLV